MKLPTFYISHGGGPCFWIETDPPNLFDGLKKSLQELPSLVGMKPKAILCISAHWEEREFTVQTGEHPEMFYDYGGFPEHTYHLKYPAPGSPELASRIEELLKNRNINVKKDPKRGFDHGLFVPMLISYPEAAIPILQLSIKRDYNVKSHYELGQALAPLREEGVLIVASGYSYHNLRNFFRGGSAGDSSLKFDEWLNHAVVESSPMERYQSLLQWEKAPAARDAHPQEDHLVPLFVAAGAASDEKAVRIYSETMPRLGIKVSSFQFGEKPKEKT